MESRPLLFLLLATSAQAATLAPDSLLCEAVTDLEFVSRQPHLKGESGSTVIKQAKLTVEGFRLHAQTARMVYIPKTRSDAVEKAELDAYQSLANSCTASGRETVTILERKAISGMVKVRTTYQGRPAELWTYAANMTE